MAGRAANDQFHSMKLRLCFFVFSVLLTSALLTLKEAPVH